MAATFVYQQADAQHIHTFFEPVTLDPYMMEEMGDKQGGGVSDPTSALVPPPPPLPLEADKVPEVPQEGDPWFASVAPPSVVSVQSSTDIVAVVAAGQVREGQRGYASIQQLRKMEFPNFCKNFNGLHMVGVLGVTENNDQSQYHISEVMAFDMDMLGGGVGMAGAYHSCRSGKGCCWRF